MESTATLSKLFYFPGDWTLLEAFGDNVRTQHERACLTLDGARPAVSSCVKPSPPVTISIVSVHTHSILIFSCRECVLYVPNGLLFFQRLYFPDETYPGGRWLNFKERQTFFFFMCLQRNILLSRSIRYSSSVPQWESPHGSDWTEFPKKSILCIVLFCGHGSLAHN